MSIATGDKKISLRVGGKDLALNGDSRSFLPMKNPEDIPSDLILEYKDYVAASNQGKTLTLHNYSKGGNAFFRLFNEGYEGISVGIYGQVGSYPTTSGVWYHGAGEGVQSMWLISHQRDGIYIGKQRVTDITGRWILK